jgi:hypothetical protein
MKERERERERERASNREERDFKQQGRGRESVLSSLSIRKRELCKPAIRAS